MRIGGREITTPAAISYHFRRSRGLAEASEGSGVVSGCAVGGGVGSVENDRRELLAATIREGSRRDRVTAGQRRHRSREKYG